MQRHYFSCMQGHSDARACNECSGKSDRREIVQTKMIDNMQCGFMAGIGARQVLFFIAWQLQEKYVAKKKDLWMAFVDLEKAFDRVPREVVWRALGYRSVLRQQK